MTAAGFGALRRDRVRDELGRVAAGIDAWLGRWKADGPQTSQIARCGEVLSGMIERLRAKLDSAPADERGLAATREIAWDLSIVEGLSGLLAERFEQRRASAFAATLKAADELIWSCLPHPPELAEAPPLPLAYVDPAFSPSATPRTKPPPTAPARDRVLAEMLRVLPVPMIGLPAGIVEEPWWLVLIAHEVGHHVQYDADPEAVKKTGAVLKEAGGDATWEAWRFEVFADLFAAVTLGPIAIEAAAELEWDLPEGLAAPRTAYPPVIVRLALMAEAARATKHDQVHGAIPFGAESWADVLAKVEAKERREVVEGQLARVAAVAAAVLDLPVGKGSLRRFAGGGAAGAPAAAPPPALTAKIRQRLRGEDVAVAKGRTLPRSAACEAFRAYRDTAAEPDPKKRVEARRKLRERAVAVIAEVGDPKTKRHWRDLTSNDTYAERMLDAIREVGRE